MHGMSFLERSGNRLLVAVFMAILNAHVLTGAAPETASHRPNILLYLVDDMGWMDSSVYGSRYYQTPNMERLARRGIVFTQAYTASPLCSATRASIMTGQYPARLALSGASGHLPPRPDLPLLADRADPSMKVVCPRSRRYLPLKHYTIAEAFRDAGYATGFIGKWHLGHEPWWPEKQGFDVNIAGGHYPGPPSYHSPYFLSTLDDGPTGEYLTDRLTDEALKYLETNRNKPFLLCLWHYAVHSPYQAKEPLVDAFRARRDPRGRQDCPTMAAMIKSQDDSLGRVLDKLDELRIADQTIVILMSDNGGNMYDDVEGTTPTNNAPLRGGKATLYEGGTRVPCLVVWPGVVTPRSQSDELITSIDCYPTLLEMARIEPNPSQQLDGISIVPALTGTGRLTRDEIFCHFPHYVPATDCLPGTYVRRGDWKLIRRYGEGPDRSNDYELYHLKDDVSERENLAGAMPDKVRDLDATITRHLNETDAIAPILNPDFGKQIPPPPAVNRPPVAGWRSAGTCRLEASSVTDGNGGLRVKSTGGDPHFQTSEVPAVSSLAVLRFRMKSDCDALGQIYWATREKSQFQRSQSEFFNIDDDGQWHDYRVDLRLDSPLRALRIDPANTAGDVEIDWIRLQAEDGSLLKAWEF